MMNTKLKCILIDDERSGLIVLSELIKENCMDVEIVGEADNIQSAYLQIEEKQPDFILLDIQMPGGSGFDLLKRYETVNFDVIFVTSFDKYAINAIKFSALDYLLKPLEISDLFLAVDKVRKRKLIEPDKNKLIINLLNNLESDDDEKKVVIHHQDRVKFIKLMDISVFEAASNYTHIFLKTGEKYTTARTLKDLEDFLGARTNFMRINKHVIINLNCVNEYSKGEPCIIYLNNSKEYELSRRKKTELSERLRK